MTGGRTFEAGRGSPCFRGEFSFWSNSVTAKDMESVTHASPRPLEYHLQMATFPLGGGGRGLSLVHSAGGMDMLQLDMCFCQNLFLNVNQIL